MLTQATRLCLHVLSRVGAGNHPCKGSPSVQVPAKRKGTSTVSTCGHSRRRESQSMMGRDYPSSSRDTAIVSRLGCARFIDNTAGLIDPQPFCRTGPGKDRPIDQPRILSYSAWLPIQNQSSPSGISTASAR